MIGVTLHLQLDAPAFGREFDGVRKQLPHDLLQARRIASHLFGPRAEIGDERDAFRFRRSAHRIQRGFEDRPEVNGAGLDLQFAPVGAGRIEQVLDGLKLRFRIALDDGGDFVDGVYVYRAVAEHPRVAEDDVQGGAQFVRDHRQEFVLRAVGGFGGRARGLLPRQLLALARFSLLALGDVYARADVAEKAAAGRVSRDAMIQYPAVLAVMTPQTVLHLKRLPRIAGRVKGFQATVVILRVNTFRPAVAQLLFHSASGEFEPRFVEESAEFVRPGHPDHDRSRVRQNTELFLARA